jgi:hypothetical protein
MNEGAQYAIIMDGKTKSHRDLRETAIEAAKYLKELYPHSQVEVRDLLDNSIVPTNVSHLSMPVKVR